MSFSLVFRMLATEKMKRYWYVSTHFRSCGTSRGALEFKGHQDWAILWPPMGKDSSR